MKHNIGVIKRDGSMVCFDLEYIFEAVYKAAKSVGIYDVDYCSMVAELTSDNIAKIGARQINVTTIQTLVERELMEGPYPKLATAYIEYRHDRDIARAGTSQVIDNIRGLINQTDTSILNENANKDAKVIPTQRDLLAGITAKDYAKKFMLPKDIVAAHDKGEIHYHDLDYAPFFPMFNCMLVDLKGMLEGGFKMGNAEIEEPKSIATATAITAQIIAQVASHIYGGTTINAIDTTLEKYVKMSYNKHLRAANVHHIRDKVKYAQSLTEKECYDAFQALEYEVNTLHTSNGQTPFVTFGFGLGTSPEAKLIQRSILQVRIAGLGKKKKTAIFPKLVMGVRDGVNLKKTDPNYDVKQLALECASKRMYPDILNYDKLVEVTGGFKYPMGCRSFLGEFNGEYEGRNNLGVVSINLPRIAIEADGSEDRFYGILNERLALCKRALMTRISRFDTVQAKVAPILYMEGAAGVRLNAEDYVADIFKNGRASISLGYIGIHETILALYGTSVTNLEEKGLEIVQYLRTAVDTWKEDTGYGFSLYSTPSENLCSRFCKLDSAQFGLLKNITDKAYYTNSFHLDVRQSTNPYDKIDFEAPYTSIATGGFISYGEYPNMQHNLEALENVWDYSYTRTPYYGTNTPIDECYSCGYTGEFRSLPKGFVCPSCGNHDAETISVTRRVCGYLGNPTSRGFNEGKQAEVAVRVKHL